MAGFDGTGPMGKGPMTGGRRGHCNPAGVWKKLGKRFLWWESSAPRAG